MTRLLPTRLTGLLSLLTLAVGLLALPTSASAQVTSTVHGSVINAAGQPVTTGEVKFSNDKPSTTPADRKYQFAFPLDASGNYKGDKLTPGDYYIIVWVENKLVDQQNFTIKPGEDYTINFDMTRAEYLKQLKPEELKAIEENKKKNAGILAENAKIGDINKTLTQARADEKNGKAPEAVAALKPLTDARPNESVIWAALGEAQLADADADYKAAKAAHTDPNAPAIQQKYTDTIASYQKAIDLDATSKKPSKETVATCYLNQGQALARIGKLKESSDAYENAVKANPTIAPTAYFNEAAILFNAQKSDEAAVAADKAIAADPKRADAYYIKGQSLIGKATLDPKTQKYVLPPGCLEAYQEYLVLVPEGGHSAEVKDLLNGLGQSQKSSFKAGKK